MFELAKRRAQAPLREPLCGDISQLRHVPGSRHGCPDTVDFETATLDNDPSLSDSICTYRRWEP
jgi:hypothetical protein